MAPTDVTETELMRRRVALGSRLRGQRLDSRLSGDELARRAELSQSKVSRLETGRVNPDPRSVQRLAAAMGLSARDSRELASEAQEIAAAARLLRREMTRSRAVARRGQGHDVTYQTCRSFAVGFMPVWLQTSDYVSSLHSRLPKATTQPGERDALAAWLQSQEDLRDPDRSFSFVIAPQVLGLHFDDEEELRMLALRLLKLLDRQPNVTFRVLDLARPLTTAFHSGFTIYDEKLVTIQLEHALLQLTDPDVVDAYLAHLRELTESACDPETSCKFLETVALGSHMAIGDTVIGARSTGVPSTPQAIDDDDDAHTFDAILKSFAARMHPEDADVLELTRTAESIRQADRALKGGADTAGDEVATPVAEHEEKPTS